MQSPIDLTSDEIHLWLASYDEIADERLHAAYRELLAPAEREQEPRFYFERDRRRYLVTRALVRTVLSKYAAVDPKEWVFSTNAYGRPEIANPEVRDLTFNLSHTHHLIVLGVTKRRALGVDVENIRDREAAIAVADHYFAPPEVAALHATPEEQQHYRFFEYWTFKESYIKARGMGLSLPLDKFSFHYRDDEAVEIAIAPELADQPERWQFWQFRPEPHYLVAVCAERSAAAPRLTVRKSVPMQSDHECALQCLRASA
ncbi:MAG TPA: 4'-phosphopantetheinyl transferase superfamily protein [Thermoanaerobaculia bacterium]|nr:4'-phosphopantetheinyl transferase superfamily protein [Thermoanaerobaculia bacterium]